MMLIILSLNTVFVARRPKNKYTQIYIHTKKKMFFFLWENSNMSKLVWRKLIVSQPE